MISRGTDFDDERQRMPAGLQPPRAAPPPLRQRFTIAMIHTTSDERPRFALFAFRHFI